MDEISGNAGPAAMEPFDLSSCNPGFDPSAGHFITAQSGDNFTRIARRENTTLPDLFAENCQFDPALQGSGLTTARSPSGGWDPDFLKPGDQVWVRNPPAAAPALDPSAITGGGLIPQSLNPIPDNPYDAAPIEGLGAGDVTVTPDETPADVDRDIDPQPLLNLNLPPMVPELRLTLPAAPETSEVPPPAPQPEAPKSRYSFNMTGTLSVGVMSSDTGGDSHTGPILDNRFPNGFKATATADLSGHWQARGVAHLWILDDTSTSQPELNFTWPQASLGVAGHDLLTDGDLLIVEGGQVRGAHDGETRYGSVPITPNAGTLVVSNTPTDGGGTIRERFADFNNPFGPGVAASYNYPLSDDKKSFLKLDASHVLYPDLTAPEEEKFPSYSGRTTGAAELRLQYPHLIVDARVRVTYDPDSANDLTGSGILGVATPIQAGGGVTVTPFVNGSGVAQGPSEDLAFGANHLLSGVGGVEVSRAAIGPDGKPHPEWSANLYGQYVNIERGPDDPDSFQLGGSFTFGEKGPVIRADYTHYRLPDEHDVREGRITGQLNF